MKGFVLGLLLAGAAATAAPFPHSLHLRAGLDCGSCHTAARTSTRPQDNLLPAKEVCLNCHESAEIPARAPAIARFSHEKHLRMGNAARYIAAAVDHNRYLEPPGDIRRHLNTKNACEACHRGLGESMAVSKADMPRMADCLVCHTKIDPPFTCETCHDNVRSLMPSSHVERFVTLHSSGKAQLDKTTCAVCHGRGFTCGGCH